MVRKIKKAKIKKLRYKLKFAKADLEETEMVFEDCVREYKERFKEMEDKRAQMEKEKGPKEKINEEKEVEEEPEIEDQDMKKIFRQIALKTHPDRIGEEVSEGDKEELVELYMRAVEASKAQDGQELLEVAYELDLKFSIDEDKEIDWLVKKSDSIGQEVAKIKQTNAWVWYHASEEERARIEAAIEKSVLG